MAPLAGQEVFTGSLSALWGNIRHAIPSQFLTKAMIGTLALLGTISPTRNNGQPQLSASTHLEGLYLLGVGIGDVTGPVVETNMFGYASMAQTDSGVHMRQWSRVFIVADSANPSQRVVYINADISAGDTAVRRGILTKLEELYPGIYTEANVALVGTHSHSGVGGYVNNLLPQLTSLGFVRQTYDAIVDGTIGAISQAHDSLAPGYLSLGKTIVQDASINRSPYSYLANPEDERARYSGDLENTMSLLKFTHGVDSGSDIGFLSWFAVHGTSIYENNTLISTDNKGMAAYLYEAYMEPDSLPGHAKFVAGFSQCGPNTLGAFCESPGQPWDGLPCDFERSTCGNRTQECHGRGPGYMISDFKSNEIIGTRQFEGAKLLMESPDLQRIAGPVRSVHTYVDMSNYTFALTNGTIVNTCPPALGFGFAGGTTDGPGAFDFVQGTNSSAHHNPMWDGVKGAVTPPPTEEEKACHWPKPILLNVGAAHKPYHWSPSIIDIQIFRVGQLVILILPSEFTTMSGRRLREAMRAKLIEDGIVGQDAYVVAVGPANTYAHYTTTREEYGIQRYEGASTLYGPNTLDAYIHLYTELANYLSEDATDQPPSGPIPEDLTPNAISLQKPVVKDSVPPFKKFGDVLEEPSPVYFKGETVQAVFRGANPRNNLRLEETFLAVEQALDDGEWKVVRTDSHPSTTFRWMRTQELLGFSTITITWTIEDSTPAGDYRIVYYGDAKHLGGNIESFNGTTPTFSIM
ncbi:hypothetical protein M407DRAFT_14431 [Tulasnella calospora MUT 4182]|uniref:Neutral ceramidase n=1 Tax=Tulasnella calospora MUT 4182 TaxID=1051891 RepID=A0A0C3L859_9AGAM|nr:hypothetical protein M407DRAFT_14431 [Tulasnella calospora MUT 4182]